MKPVVVTTAGGGSMDGYGRELARHLGVEELRLDLAGASADVFGAWALSRRGLATLPRDARLVRALRRHPGLLHLTHHHLARYVAGLRRRYVVTVHDLIRHRDAAGEPALINRSTGRDRLGLRLDLAGIRGAAAVVAVSAATKAELLDRLGLGPERVTVVPEGIDTGRFHPVPERPVPPPYLLFVGSEHPRKDLPTLLRAFAELKRDPAYAALRLVKVGADGDGSEPYRGRTLEVVEALGLGGEVVFAGAVPDAALPGYYSGAAALVLPSRAEGFGLPPLEAMACGCPVVVSDAGALPEVTGGAALTFPVGDAGALAAALRRLLDDPAEAARLRRLGHARVAELTWPRVAREVREVYRRLGAELS